MPKVSRNKEWQRPLKIFFSYSHADATQRAIMARNLQALRDDGLIRDWYDRDLPLGEWRPALVKELEEADIFLFLITSSFLVSEFCRTVEFERAVERYEQGDCHIVPIALTKCDWPKYLKEFTALPSLDSYVTGFPEEDGYAEVAKMLREQINRLLGTSNFKRTTPAVLSKEPDLDLLPYLCDRTDQEVGLRRAFSLNPKGDTRPFVLISCGPDQECHEAFLDRVRRSPLPFLMGVQDKPQDWTPVQVDWPQAYRAGQDPVSIFEARVVARMNPLVRDSSSLASSLREGLTVVATTVWADPLKDRDNSLLQAYLDYWNCWPPIRKKRALVVAIWVKYPMTSTDIEDLRRRLDFTQWPKIRGVVLDELKPVGKGDAQNWAGFPEVRRQYPPARYQQLCSEISKLYPAITSTSSDVAALRAATETAPSTTLAPGSPANGDLVLSPREGCPPPTTENDALPMQELASGLMDSLRKVVVTRHG